MVGLRMIWFRRFGGFFRRCLIVIVFWTYGVSLVVIIVINLLSIIIFIWKIVYFWFPLFFMLFFIIWLHFLFLFLFLTSHKIIPLHLKIRIILYRLSQLFLFLFIFIPLFFYLIIFIILFPIFHFFQSILHLFYLKLRHKLLFLLTTQLYIIHFSIFNTFTLFFWCFLVRS